MEKDIIKAFFYDFIFWFILLGPLGIICYRLLQLLQQEPETQSISHTIVQLLDWITVRFTLIFYLFAGNFQNGVAFLQKQILTPPENNQFLLGEGGLKALNENDEENPITLHRAVSLVERALIILLVFIAILTLLAW